MNRRLAANLIALALLAASFIPVRAEHLVAPEMIPPDAVFVLSAPDTEGLWTAVKQTPLQPAMAAIFELPAFKNNPEFKDFLTDKTAAEKQLGFLLEPETLMSKVISGIDISIAMRKSDPTEPDLILSVKFKTAEAADKILKRIESEAAQAAAKQDGDATPVPGAPTPAAAGLKKQTIEGKTVFVYPGSGMWLYQQKELMVFSTSEGAMKKALSPMPKEHFGQSTIVRDGLAALGNPAQPHVFVYADFINFLKAVNSATNENAAALMQLQNMAADVKIVGVGTAYPDHVDFKLYMPKVTNEPIMSELARLYPPSEQRIAKLVPSGALLSITYNNIDGARIMDLLVKVISEQSAPKDPAASTGPGTLRDSENAAVKAQIELAQMEFEKTMGFKLKEDLLAAVGPELGIVLDSIKFDPKSGSPAPVVDLTVALKIKDKAKLDLILPKVQKYAEQEMSKMMEGADDSAAPSAPGATPKPKATVSMKDITVPGGSGKILALPQAPPYTPGWIVIGDYIVLGSTENALKRAAQALAGESPSLAASPEYGKVKKFLPAKSNVEVAIGSKKIVGFVTNLAMLMGGSELEGEKGEVFMAVMDALKTIDTVWMTQSNSPNGETLSNVLLMFGRYTPQPSASAPASSDTQPVVKSSAAKDVKGQIQPSAKRKPLKKADESLDAQMYPATEATKDDKAPAKDDKAPAKEPAAEKK